MRGIGLWTYAGLTQSVESTCAVSHTGGKQGCMRKVGTSDSLASPSGTIDAEPLELVHRANHLRIVRRIAKVAQRDDRVQHGRIDGAKAVRLLEAPASTLPPASAHACAADECARARTNGRRDRRNRKEVAPGDRVLLVPAQPEVRHWRDHRRTSSSIPCSFGLGIFLKGFFA